MDHARKKISCAVIGLGNFGKHYIRLLSANARANLVAVASPSVDSSTVNIGPGVKRYADAKKIFADTTIDAVIIATPASTHVGLATEAIASGKHVLLEKPLATNPGEAKRIESALHDGAKKVFMLGHQYLYNDYVAELKQELDAGRIGSVRYVHAEQLYPGPIRHDIGCFRESATHELAIIDYLFAPGEPVAAVASGIDLSGGSREDFAAASITYASGLFAHIIVSSYSPVKSRRMILGGERGMAFFDGRAFEEKLSFFLQKFPAAEKLHQQKSLSLPKGDVLVIQPNNPHEPLAREIEHFLDCIENHSTPRSDIIHAMRVERALHLVSQAIKLA